MALGVIAINESTDNGDSGELLLALKQKSVALRSLTPECAQQYSVGLKKAKDMKDDPSKISHNIAFCLGTSLFYNKNK